MVLHLEVVVLEIGGGGQRILTFLEWGGREPVGRTLRLEPRPDARLVGHRGELAVRPAELLAQLEGAVVAHLVRPGVRKPAHRQHQGVEAGGTQLCRVGLGVGPIGGAPHAHRRQGVVEADDPLDGVEPVGGVEFVVLLEDALGEVEAPHVLHHHHVAVVGEPARLLGEAFAGLVVRSAVEQHRERLVHRLAVAAGAIDVGSEPHAVAHREHEVLFDLHRLVRRRDAQGRIGSLAGVRPARRERDGNQQQDAEELHAATPAAAPESAAARSATRGASSTASTRASASSIRSGERASTAQSRNFCRSSSRVRGRSGPPG